MATIKIIFADDVKNPNRVAADIIAESGLFSGKVTQTGAGYAHVEILSFDDAEVEEAWNEAMDQDDRVVKWHVV